MRTPWGKADSVTQLAQHVYWTGTPGHGGVMIAKGTARRLLSEAAIKRGRSFGNYLAYEEDCDYAIVAYEFPGAFASLFGKKTSEIEAEAHKSLSAWNADYLLERGIAPDSVAYVGYVARQKDRQRRAAKDPDLIIAALDLGEGKCKVWTADDAEHVVPLEKYEDTREAGRYSLAECK